VRDDEVNMTEQKSGRGTILIVDDEPDVVFFISKVCQPQGYHTITASSGLEALRYLEELSGKIDLVLLDLRMPGMGGIEVLKSIRRHYGDLPVIVLTALSDKRKECEEIGIEAFMTKPYSLEDLYHRITAVIGEKEEEGQIPQVPEGFVPGARVLIVDDEKEVCEILSESLVEDVSDARYEVRYATSGDEALRLADEFEPDIAIVDIKMQHMWGDELIEKFKAGAAFCPKDFVVFTAADMPDQREKARKSGYKYLTKPAKLEELIEVLKKICIRHKLLRKV
jgi:two-component system response regulator (stage 0 sporulation protein F)